MSMRKHNKGIISRIVKDRVFGETCYINSILLLKENEIAELDPEIEKNIRELEQTVKHIMAAPFGLKEC
jgi:hypothetical protein